MIWPFGKVKQRNPDSFFCCAFSLQIPTLAEVMARKTLKSDPVQRHLGAIPYRLQLAGGWIDQKFKSSMAMKSISRGSDEFQALDSGLRSIAQQLGGQVIVVWKGHAYLIK